MHPISRYIGEFGLTGVSNFYQRNTYTIHSMTSVVLYWRLLMEQSSIVCIIKERTELFLFSSSMDTVDAIV